MIVCKFGGTSLADAGQIRKVAAIVRQSAERSVVVVSAPGKRGKDDEKITDILISCHRAASAGEDVSERFAPVRERYTTIAAELGIGTDLEPVLDEVERDIRSGADLSAVVSRGEYLGAHLVSSFLGFEFVDAADIIRFADETTVDDEATDRLVRERLAPAGRYVVPGFYGAFANGRVQLFSRGGSDISAALLARALDAEVYENWTDVSGLLSADPRIVADAAPISRVSYRELRELAYLGANVFHDEAIAPVAQKQIPIQIRNTNEPAHPGTTIGAAAGEQTADGRVASLPGAAARVTGVAGRTGFVAIHVERPMVSREPRYLDRLRAALLEEGIPVRHSVAGSDSLLLVCGAQAVAARRAGIVELLRSLGAATVAMSGPTAIIGLVCPAGGIGPGLLSAVMGELDREGIGVVYASVGESPHTAVFGVSEERYVDGVRALYRAGLGQ